MNAFGCMPAPEGFLFDEPNAAQNPRQAWYGAADRNKAVKYKSVIAARRGGPEVLQVIENDLRMPSAREARIKILAAPVSLPDVEARYGRSPFKPKLPFVPG